jgi:hypothetical protein
MTSTSLTPADRTCCSTYAAFGSGASRPNTSCTSGTDVTNGEVAATQGILRDSSPSTASH